MPLTDDQVVRLLPALEEAARADPEQTPARFVPPRVGILETVAAARHQFVFGRRGVGKSTLLRKLQHDAGRFHSEVLFIDVETLRQRPYPDVLIELLIELLDALRARHGREERWRPAGMFGRTQTRWRMRKLRNNLHDLLSAPQEAQHTVRKLQKRNKGGTLGIRLRHRGVGGDGQIGGSGEKESSEQAEFTQTKMDGLLAAAIQIRRVLESASEHFDTPTLIVLDDFYHVVIDDQAEVLAYLHQVAKNLPIHLKICGVRHRIRPFVEGDPPTGLQLGHDAGDISLDITLEQFQAAQQFLESVLAGVCAPLGFAPEELATDTGRERLVLGSGGVARDYLELVSKALRKASERPARPDRPHNRITAEDVNEAAGDLSTRKQDDLALDAGPEADRLRERLAELVRFCLDRNGTNVFLVEGTELHETQWGQEIEALTDLRLMHELGNFSLPSDPWRGRRFVGYTLDLSHWTGTRSERIRQIEFWKPGGRREMRRTGLVYTPDRARVENDAPELGDPPELADAAPVNWEQPPLPVDGDEPEQGVWEGGAEPPQPAS